MKKFLNIIFITEMPMAALRQSISLYCRGAAAATYFFLPARQRLNFWEVFVYFYRKNL
jgi:hypothetical protein